MFNLIEVIFLIKKLYNNVKGKWFEFLDFVEFYCLIEVLLRGV